jgi:hypothetical protein
LLLSLSCTQEGFGINLKSLFWTLSCEGYGRVVELIAYVCVAFNSLLGRFVGFLELEKKGESFYSGCSDQGVNFLSFYP